SLADGEDGYRLAANQRAGDVIADHLALRGGRDLRQRERAGQRLRRAPGAAGIGRGYEADLQLARCGGTGGVGVEVVVQADVCARPGRRRVHADAWDEMV